MSLPTRADVRLAYTDLLRAELVTSSGVAQVVYGYFVKDFGGQSPAVVVADGGAWPHAFTRHGTQADYYLQVLCFALRGETGTSYDEGDADTILDNLLAGLIKVTQQNQVTPQWKAIGFMTRSGIEAARIGGWDYWLETHYLEFEVF